MASEVKHEAMLLNSQFMEAALENAEHVGEVISPCDECGEPKFKYEVVDTGPLGAIVLPCIQKCKCDRMKPDKEALMLKSRLLDAYAFSVTPPDVEQVTFDNWDPQGSDALKSIGERFCKNYDDYRRSGMGFVLQGPSGIGKTHMLRCVTYELSRCGWLVSYATLQEITSAIRESYSPSSNTSEGFILKKLMTADVLIIDEIGVGKPTEWMVDTTYRLVDTMYRSRKPMLFATNLDKAGLERYFADKRDGIDRIVPRVIERSPIISFSKAFNYRALKSDSRRDILAGKVS